MSQLIQDVFIVENLQILTEGTSGKIKISGVFGRCNEANKNGRIYPTAVLESQLKKVQPLISERRLCGELDHPQNDTVKLSNASHLITKLEMKGDELIGEAEILSTPAGLTAKALIEGGVKIGISSRGMGTLSEDAQGNKIVNEDFRLVTFDLVADPSTRGAYPGLSESVESQFISESTSVREKESNFLTLLEARLRESYSPLLVEKKSSKKAEKAKKCEECGKVKCECEKERETLPEGVVSMAGKLADAFAARLDEVRAAATKEHPENKPKEKAKLQGLKGDDEPGTSIYRPGAQRIMGVVTGKKQRAARERRRAEALKTARLLDRK